LSTQQSGQKEKKNYELKGHFKSRLYAFFLEVNVAILKSKGQSNSKKKDQKQKLLLSLKLWLYLVIYEIINSFLSLILRRRGLEGEECVQRTICESTSPRQGKRTFMEEVIKVLFR